MMSEAANQNSAQELYFLYQLAQVLSSSIDLDEVAEYTLDGACALIGAEQGFLCALETPPAADEPTDPADAPASAEITLVQPALPGQPAPPTLHAQPGLRPYGLRYWSPAALEALAPALQPVWETRQGLVLSRAEAPAGEWCDLLAAPLVVRDAVQGIVVVSTATRRAFTAHELERLVSVAGLAALALDNARLYDQTQRELQVMRQLIDAARQMSAGRLSDEQISALETSVGWGEISRLSQSFAHMARQVIQREAQLQQKVRELEIVIDEAKRDQQIAEIESSDFFQRIQQKASQVRARRSHDPEA